MSKSLGEKLFDAMLGVAGETELWAGIGAKEQAQTERIALAFAASLSHDETATATIEALKAERDSLLAALERFGEISGEGDEDFPDGTPVTVRFGRSTNYSLNLGDLRRAAALTTKEG